MTAFEDLLESAVKDGTAPGIVVIAKDKDGKVSPINCPLFLAFSTSL